MSGNGLIKSNLAVAPMLPGDRTATPRHTGPITGPTTRHTIADLIDTQDLQHIHLDPVVQTRGAPSTQPDLEWDDIFSDIADKKQHDHLRALIAGIKNSYTVREWAQLDPLDRSFLSSLRQSAAVSLLRTVDGYLEEDHPLLPDVVNAARKLFEDGITRNSRLDRMLAAEIIVAASPYAPVGFKPAYRAAAMLRQFIETQVNRNKFTREPKPWKTALGGAARTKPRPPTISAEMIRVMKKKSLELAERRVIAATDEALACMRAYEGLIPRFKRGHTEIMAGMLMCSAVIEDGPNRDLIGKAYELQGQLADVQLSSPYLAPPATTL